MFDKIRNNQLLRNSILVLLVLFFIESIIFQIAITIKFRNFQYHNHILDEGSILTFDDLTDKKSGLFDISDDYCAQFNRVRTAGSNTFIDAILVNTSGVNLSGVHFYIVRKKLTEDGKKRSTEDTAFTRKEFEDDDLCVDPEKLSVKDVEINVEPGIPKQIHIIIKNYKISEDDILLIRGYCKYIQFKDQ